MQGQRPWGAEDLFWSVSYSWYEQSGKTDCSQIYFVGCSHSSKLLVSSVLLTGKQTYHKAYPSSLTPCRGSYKDLKD